MKALEVCPSTLIPGFTGYSPHAVKTLFDGVAVSPIIDIDFESELDQRQAMENMNSLSISGAQEKFSAVIDNGSIRLSHEGEQAEAINAFEPDVLVIGMTAPKQEKWAYQNKPYCRFHVSIAVGNVFDWYAGNAKRPSLFWQKIGMEWLVRIFYRPEIFRRNIGNQMRFFRHLALDLLNIRKFGKNTPALRTR